MFNRRRAAKSRTGQKKHGLSNPKSIMALAAGRSPRLFFGKERSEKILFEKTLKNSHALASFDACIEACDALAASGGQAPLTSLDQSKNEHDFEVCDCSVIVSPDGALLFQPKSEGAHGSLMSCASSNASIPSDRSSSDDETKATDSNKISSVIDTELHDELFPGEEFESSIVMGSDMTAGSDKVVNGFSAKGWNPHLATASIRQAVKTLEATGSFVEELILSRKNSAASTSQACDQLRDMLIMENMDDEIKQGAIVVTPEKQEFKRNGEHREDDVNEGIFSGSNGTERSKTIKESNMKSSNATASAKSQAGPLLFPGSSLHEALVAMDQYYSKVSEGESLRWRMASLTSSGLASNDDGPLPAVQQAAKKAEQRASRREKGILDMQLILAEAELILKTRKDETKKLWKEVHKGEEEVNRRLENITRERSRQREHKRRKEENERQAAISAGTLESTVTQQEIWELVSQMNVEEMSFAPTGLPAPKSTGPIDKSMSPKPNTGSREVSNENVPGHDANDIRGKLEDELGLNKIRKSAVEADEDVKDTAGALLNILSVNDTTKRSACVAAETCLLSSATAQSHCLKSLVRLERASIEERLKLIEKLEGKINSINIRKDLNMFIEHDKAKIPLGTTRVGEDDDGGIASALAVLNCHSECMNGVGVSEKTEISSFSGWGDDGGLDEVVDREVLEAAVEDIFIREKTVDYSKLDTSVQLLVNAVSEKAVRARGYRASTCYAINQHRGRNTKLYHEEQFEGLCQVLDAILTGCDRESADISSAKMCMMLAQTFYITKEVDDKVGDDSGMNICKIYPNKRLCNHPIWSDEDFWVQALFQCVTESLSQSGVMLRVRMKKSESARKVKWHDLSLDERAEAASQVHAVIFAQLGALAHSMIEFGCSVGQAVAFVRKLSVRHQLPLSQRTMLLSHLMRKNNG